MFIDVCKQVGQDFPDVAVDDFIVDAMMAHVVRAPQRFDFIVTTNMFGDILSDLTSELSGSLGLAGSLNAGEHHAMAQAAHGSTPDIAGKNIAIVKTQQLTNLRVSVISAIPYLFATVGPIIWAAYSDKHDNKIGSVAAACLLATAELLVPRA